MQELVPIMIEAERLAKEVGVEAQVNYYRNVLSQKIRPFNFLLKFNLASALHAAGQDAEAETLFLQVIEESPRFINSYFNLGVIYDRKGETDKAINFWQQTIKRADISNVDQRDLAIRALNQCARVEEERKNYHASKESLELSLKLDPIQPGAIQHLVRARQMLLDWPTLAPIHQVSANQMLMATSPLSMLAVADDYRLQLLSAVSFVHRTYDLKQKPSKRAPKSKSKMRIGYVSGDLCTHAVGLLLPDFIRNHDKDRFEVIAYDYSVRDGTELRQRLLQAFDRVVDITALSDDQAAEVVLRDDIDILFDMHGLSAKARPNIFARRPGRLQVSWLGFIGTSALPWLDAVILDDFSFEKGNEIFMSESPILMSHSLLPGRTNHLPSFLSARAGSRQSDVLTFACFNNAYKINEKVISAWAEILKRVTKSRLWVASEDKLVRQRLLSEFKRRGISEERVTFQPKQTYQAYRHGLREVDVYLDTFPYCAGSVARDVAEECVPSVTLAGHTPIARMGGSVLKEIGLAELIATDEGEYVEKACYAAEHAAFLRTSLQEHYSQHAIRIELERCRELESLLVDRLIHLSGS